MNRNLRNNRIFYDGAIILLVAAATYLAYDLASSGKAEVPLPDDALAMEIASLEARLAGAGRSADPYDWMDLARLYHLRKDLPRAIEALQSSLKLRELIVQQKYAILVRLSELQLEAGQLTAAWKSATDASRINPERAPAFNRRGDVRYTEGLTGDALVEYETASRVEPGHPESYARRAGVFHERGESARAEELLKRGVILSQGGEEATASANLGRYYLQEGRLDQALQVLQDAAQKHPDHAGLQAALGEAYATTARDVAGTDAERRKALREKAIAAYRKAAALDRRDARVRERLGDLHRANGDRAAAHAAYREALRYDRDNAGLRGKYIATSDRGERGEFGLAVRSDGAIVVPEAPGKSSTPNNGDDPDATEELTGAPSPRGDAEEAVLVTTTDAQGRPVTAALTNFFDKESGSATTGTSTGAGGREKTAAALKTRGREFYLNKKYARALAEFQQAAAADPRDGEAQYLSGRTSARLGRDDSAREAYKQAIALSPKDYRAHYHLGELEYRRKQYLQAARHFTDALELKADLDGARFNLGLSQSKAGQTGRAIATYRELLKRAPERWEAALNLAILLKQQKDGAGALVILNRYTRSHSDQAALHYQKGEVHAGRGELKDALAAYGRALAIEPRHYQAHFNRGVLFARQGDARSALQAYEQARQINDADPELYYAIGRLQKQSGESAAAVAALERALSIQPGHTDATIELVPLYLQRRRKLEAISVMQRASAANPRDYRLLFNAGNLYRKLDEHSDARQAYRQAIEVKPGRADAYLNLALSFRDTDDVSEAISTYQSLLARQPAHAGAHEQLGLLLWQDPKRRSEGRAHLVQFLALEPGAQSAAEIRRLLESGQ